MTLLYSVWGKSEQDSIEKAKVLVDGLDEKIKKRVRKIRIIRK